MCAAVFGGFNYQNSDGNPTDNAVADREVLGRGRRSQGKLRDYCPAVRQKLFHQLSIFFGIDHIYARSEYGYRFSFGSDGLSADFIHVAKVPSRLHVTSC